MIVELEMQHLDDVMEIENKSFAAPWTRNMFLEELQNAKARYFVAVENEKVVGYCGVWLVLDEGHIMTIAVAEESRGRGIGTMLMQKLIDECEGMEVIMLEVRRGNEGAQRLYARFGFEVLGERKGYYNGEDAIIMQRV